MDKDYKFIHTKEFAEYIQGTDNYYVMITRKPLYYLPYSVKEIYGIRTSGKFHFPEQVYHEFYPIYKDDPIKRYNKEKLSEYYTGKNAEKILYVMPEEIRNLIIQ